MRREGRVRDKPSNKARVTRGRCRFGSHKCRDVCLEHAGEKLWKKRKHCWKKFAGDVCANPALADFYLQPRQLSRRLRGEVTRGDGDERLRSWCSAVQDEMLMILESITVNNVIEDALAKNRFYSKGGDDDEVDFEEDANLACTTYGLGGGAPPLAGDLAAELDIGAIELAFQRQLGIFENAVEGSSFSEYATQGWCTMSEESWSEVELLPETDIEEEDDSWSMVDHVITEDGAPT